MLSILNVIAPVFLLVLAGYVFVRSRVLSPAQIDGLMAYAMKVAIPFLLFSILSKLDFATIFSIRLIGAFYIAATICFFAAFFLSRAILKRPSPDAVAIGFAALFSNGFLMGVPITERAFGVEATGPNYAIISVHSAFCFTLGIVMMEWARAEKGGGARTYQAVLNAMVRNAFMIGILSGLVANLIGFEAPEAVATVVDMIAKSAFPAALFAMGGVLVRFQMKRSLGAAGLVTALSIIVHPALVLLLGQSVFDLPSEFLRSAVLTAAMPTGVSAYAFASLYDRATGATASALLLATALSVVTIPIWLLILGT